MPNFPRMFHELLIYKTKCSDKDLTEQELEVRMSDNKGTKKSLA